MYTQMYTFLTIPTYSDGVKAIYERILILGNSCNVVRWPPHKMFHIFSAIFCSLSLTLMQSVKFLYCLQKVAEIDQYVFVSEKNEYKYTYKMLVQKWI